LFLIYGVAGIGKSELVYEVIREIRTLPAWSDAVPLLVDVGAGTTTSRILAQLLAATGAGAEPRRGQATEQEHFNEQLQVVANALEARPYLLFVDDVHHLSAGPVAEALAYLSRRVSKSRLFVASRVELQLPPHAPPPVVTTLGPLEPSAAEQMMKSLAERMQLPPCDAQQLMSASHGSPFYIRRMLSGRTGNADSVTDSLGELEAPQRHLLLTAAVTSHRPSSTLLRRKWSSGETSDPISALEQRFLLDVSDDRVVVHDLIREAVLGAASPSQLASAHADAAELCLAELGSAAAPSLLLAVDAIEHFMAANKPDQAWGVVVRWHSALATAGSDHLLREPLEQLREALPNQRIAIDLIVARNLVRASMIAAAHDVLERVGSDRTDSEDAHYCLLAGELALRDGDFAGAETLFQRAAERTPDETVRFQAQLQLANAAVFASDGARARDILDGALSALASPTPRQRGRWGWMRSISLMFDESFECGAEQARKSRLALEGAGLDDLSSRLAMVETLSCIESDQMGRAREAAALIEQAGARRRVAALYRSLVDYANGEVRKACTALREAHEYLSSHGDIINAYLAGYYGSCALAAIGELGAAQGLAARSARLAEQAHLGNPAAQAVALQALLAAEALQCDRAHELAAKALESKHIGPRSRARAHCAHAHAYTIQGDVTQGLEHIALAREQVQSPDMAAARAAIDAEHAGVELVGGNRDRAVELAEAAVDHYKKRSRHYESARAQLFLAATYFARGRRSDIVLSQQALDSAKELGKQGELRSVLVGCAILSAALARRDHSLAEANELLAEALRGLDPERGSVYADTLLAAIEGGVAARAVPGIVALLAHLGFVEAVDRYIVDAHGRRAATDKDMTRERGARQLFVDEVRATIAAGDGAVEISGRPMQSTLLSVLIQARGDEVSADTLYKRVWGVSEYHPLQHRNALYVSINRLRKSLRPAFPDSEVIERAPGGWRLADGIDACVAVAAHPRSS